MAFVSGTAHATGQIFDSFGAYLRGHFRRKLAGQLPPIEPHQRVGLASAPESPAEAVEDVVSIGGRSGARTAIARRAGAPRAVLATLFESSRTCGAPGGVFLVALKGAAAPCALSVPAARSLRGIGALGEIPCLLPG
ncbi:MAG: hypothetical protein ACREH9_00960 [Pseudomonadota bacterium]